MHGKRMRNYIGGGKNLKGMDDFKELSICGRLILKMNRTYIGW